MRTSSIFKYLRLKMPSSSIYKKIGFLPFLKIGCFPFKKNLDVGGLVADAEAEGWCN
jgi:hypothetical protein